MDNNILSLTRKLESTGFQYAFYYHRRPAEPICIVNCEIFPAASLIKVPILFAWLALENEGLLDRGKLCCLDSLDNVQGAGFSGLFSQRQIPFADALLLMIAISDNQCANLVIQHIGMARLNQIFKINLGLQDTIIQRYMMDFASQRNGMENFISTRDCIQLFKIYRGLSETDRKWVDELLSASQDTSFFLRNIQRDTLTFFHKSANLPGVFHDWGFTKNCQLFLLTQHVEDEDRVNSMFGDIGTLLLHDE